MPPAFEDGSLMGHQGSPRLTFLKAPKSKNDRPVKRKFLPKHDVNHVHFKERKTTDSIKEDIFFSSLK